MELGLEVLGCELLDEPLLELPEDWEDEELLVPVFVLELFELFELLELPDEPDWLPEEEPELFGFDGRLRLSSASP